MKTESRDQNTEKTILEAAEAEFLEKGYGNAKVLSIARRAGVSHSMLHYYFRSKERLFQVVFDIKAQEVSTMFEDIFSQNLPFDETVRLFIETQFNFVARNPKLPYFLLTEIINNKDNRTLLFEMLSSKAKALAIQIQIRLREEIARGTIREISSVELLINIASINIFTFIYLPILADIMTEDMLAVRRESNVQFILNSLRK